MTYLDSVSVIMATCPRTLLHVLASTTEKSMNGSGVLARQCCFFMVPWWTTRGVRYDLFVLLWQSTITGLDWWTGPVDWTGGLDRWTGLVD